MKRFSETAIEFRAYHNNSFNVFLHLITTPVAMACVVGAIEERLGAVWTRGAFWAYAGALIACTDASMALKACTTALWCGIVYAGTVLSEACGMKEIGVIFACA